MKMLAFSLSFLTLLIAHPSCAQQQLTAPNFTRLTEEHGLANNNVLVALRDQRGFLWFGTEGGLSRFDGLAFFNFYEQDGLVNNTVKDMVEDPDGTLWIAMLGGGLTHFDPATGKCESWKTDPNNPEMKSKGAHYSLTSICQDGDLLWLGTYKRGLVCFSKKERRFTGWFYFRQDSLKTADNFQYNSVNQVIADRRHPDFFWLAANGRGIARFNKSDGSFDLFPLGNFGAAAMSILQDEQGIVWAGTWSAGVARFDPASRQMAFFPHDLARWKAGDVNRNVAVSVVEKNAGELWVATPDNGFGIFEKSGGKYHFFQNHLSGESPELDRNCAGLYLDPALHGRLWALGVQGGVRSFDFENQSFRYVSLASGGGKAERAEVTAFAFDPARKTVFVATENNGCFEWSDAANRLTQRAKPISGGTFPNFRTLLSDAKGNIWAGAAKTLSGEASLYLLRPGQALFEPVTVPAAMSSSPQSIFQETVNDLFQDSKGNVWVATSYDGLYKFSLRADGRAIAAMQQFNHEKGFATGSPAFEKWFVFLDIKEDRQGHLWLATKSNGVLNFDPQAGSFDRYDPQNLLLSNNAWALEIAADRSLWVGTFKEGLQTFLPEGKTARVFDEDDGLPGVLVSAVAKDEAGNLWLATDKGLALFEMAAKKFNLFGRGNGLKDGYLVGKGLAIIPGMGLLVGQPNGFCLLPQTSGKPKIASPAKVVLTDFLVFDQSKYFEKNILSSGRVVLKPSENRFAFEFSAPASPHASLENYQFMLEGFDEKWYLANSGRSFTYTHLPPGNYTFRVRAAMGSGEFSSETTLKVFVQPNWWQTWWFRLATVLAIASAVFAGYKYRTRQLKNDLSTQKQLAELERKALQAQMNPHFIFNSLNSIQNYIVRNENQTAAIYLSRFATLVRSMLNASVAGKISLEEEAELLENYLSLEKMRLGERFDFEVKVAEDTDPFGVYFPPMLVQPYVENAVLHGIRGRSSGGRISISFRETAGYLEVAVQDNGNDFSPAPNPVSTSSADRIDAPPHKSVGMSITRRRMELLEKSDRTDLVQMEEIKDDGGKVTGTLVRLKIKIEDC